MKMASSKKESAARGDSGSAPETEAETAVLSGAEDDPLLGRGRFPAGSSRIRRRSSGGHLLRRRFRFGHFGGGTGCRGSGFRGRGRGRALRTARTHQHNGEQNRQNFSFHDYRSILSAEENPGPRRAAAERCASGLLAGLRQENTRHSEKSGPNAAAPAVFPLILPYFRKGRKTSYKFATIAKPSCVSMPCLQKNVQKKGTESRRHAPFPFPRLRAAGCNRSKLFLVEDGHDVHKVAVVHHGIAVKRRRGGRLARRRVSLRPCRRKSGRRHPSCSLPVPGCRRAWRSRSQSR